MSRPLSHQEYLAKKYLSQNDYEEPKKKKKKKVNADGETVKRKAPTVQIVDEDIDIRDIRKRYQDQDEDLHFVVKEEKPEIADVIDDRPLARQGDKNTKSKWKRIDPDDDDDDKDSVFNKGGDSYSKAKGEKMSSGARAGLSKLSDLKAEARELKRKHNKIMKNLPEEISGKNATIVYRDKKSGKIRDVDKEKMAKQEEESEKKAIHDRMRKGIVQVDRRKEQLEEDLKEMSKPLARGVDDEDLNDHQREQIRAEDPLFALMQEKKLEERKAKDPNFKVLPKYKGPPPPRNRFNIQPGYRWDGVNRSNGYEERYFKQLNLRSVQEEEAYKWSVQDM